jgi:hypothetical protein
MQLASPLIQKLQTCGVVFPAPETVFVDATIQPDRIAPGTVIHPGCRLSGTETAIGPGCELGREAPLTLIDSQLGAGVRAAGGFIEGATLLDGVALGACAHVRPGCLLEEGASCGHAVGLKQTLLLPFVTLGSTINFCDILMAGGTSSSNHGEVGSSYIHFNFTPHQDKATASLLGDIPQGVMLDQPPIFLGGQGGLVGPSRITYGTTIAAGTIFREDVLEPGKLCFGQPLPQTLTRDYAPGQYGCIDRICLNNLVLIGNLHALHAWYTHVRPRLMPNTPHTHACIDGAKTQIQHMIQERIKRLGQLAEKLEIAQKTHPPKSDRAIAQQQKFCSSWPSVGPQLQLPTQPLDSTATRDAFLAKLPGAPDANYTTTIQSLPPETRATGTRWLNQIVNPFQALAESMNHE